ncbi:restriction endonuclease [Agrobacterium vitis]|uniref:restriction endonuclease n=1 Tax=Agrobacterium vitis TaxID=373 RepID=UPI0012E7CADB|nr:restriction endonuclease [Agrobacterium vitis]MUZ65681.1 hypothetical protein [Agrobacterium vitis]
MSNLDEIRKEYEELANLPLDSDGAAKRRRGFAFERLLNKLFKMDELEPRAGYRPEGEQIDGSIYLDGRVYLLEAKWHADPLPASTLYQFKGKVDGKLAGTIGIFISISGYAKDAIDALTLGKGLNVVLFDRRDMDAAILRGNGFKQVLKLKLRKAAEEGAIYFPAEGELVTADETRVVEIEHLRFDHTTGGLLATQPAEPAAADLLIVCEGDADRVVIATLAERILAQAGSGRSIKILTAMGKLIIPRVANALWNTFDSHSKVLIVTDGDNDPAGTSTMLTNGLEFNDWIAAIPNPSIETWLGLDPEILRRRGGKSRIEQSRVAAQNLDIEALKKHDDQFARFHDAILGA